MLAFFSGAAIALHQLHRIHDETVPDEVLYIPSAKALKRMSLGYTGLVADLYWTRAIQYFGWKHKHKAIDYHLLYPLLDITTELDPHLIVAYRFGATFLGQEPPNGAGEPDKAAALIERGIKANPDEWRLYYELGFLDFMERHDYKAAADAFRRGSLVPHPHPFLKVLAAEMAQNGGDVQTARSMWNITLETTEDAMIKKNAQQHLQALDVDQTVPKLEDMVRQFREKTGVQPTNFLPLVKAGWLRGIPTDPLGHPYKIDPQGRVVVQDPESLPFIMQGVPSGYNPDAPPKQ